MRGSAAIVCALLVVPAGCDGPGTGTPSDTGKRRAEPGPATPVAPPPVELEVWRLVKVRLARGGGESEEYAGEVTFRPETAKADDGAAGKPDGQPVGFSHDQHAGKLGIDCRYCHTGTGTTVIGGGPKVCMNCHERMWPGLVYPVSPGDVRVEGRKRWFVARRDAGKTPKEIDLTECDASRRLVPGTVVRRGIYREGEGSLLIALTFGAVADGYRPSEFKPASLTPAAGGSFAGVALFHLTK